MIIGAFLANPSRKNDAGLCRFLAKNFVPNTTTTSTTKPTTTTTTTSTPTTPITTTSSLCTSLSKVKAEIFSTLKLICNIKAIIQSNYGLVYKDGELKTAIASVTPNSALALQLCGG